MHLTIKQGSIVAQNVDAIVNPANSFGHMGGGVALALKTAGGEVIEEEAIAQCPVNVGEAILTTSGDLVAGYVIHAPVMENPAEKTTDEKVGSALHAALELAEQKELHSLAIPGMGTGVGEVTASEAASIMLKTLQVFSFKHVQDILLIDTDEKVVKAWLSQAPNLS